MRIERNDGRSMTMNIKRRGVASRIIALILTLLVAMAFSQSAFAAGKTKINYSKKKMFVEDSVQLKVKRAGKSLKGVKWSSGNKEIATVSKSGKVIGKASGKTTITGKYENKKYKCKITVMAGACNHPKKDCCIPG